MYETITVVGERGQITIPKDIRELENLKAKDRVIVKLEGSKIVVEKKLNKREKEKLMKEYYLKYAKENEELCREMEPASLEAGRLLDDY